MNMNGEAVDSALVLAGNLPLTRDDKLYNNMVYRLCRMHYLPVLFTSLCEIDWKCARKYAKLIEVDNNEIKQPGKFYYYSPADCIKPIHVDDNTLDFRSDKQYIITGRPADKLYYVFHNRNATFHSDFEGIAAGRGSGGGNYPYIVRAPLSAEEYLQPGAVYHVPLSQPERTDEDFPEWDYTPYDPELWEYFSYKLASRLIPKLRAEDAAGTKTQAMLAMAKQVGSEAILRERSAEANINQSPQTWSEKLGLRSGYSDSIGGWSDRRR